MQMRYKDTTRQFFTKRIISKEEELIKVEADLEEAPTQDIELKLARKAERLLQEIQDLYDKLSKLDTNNPQSNTQDFNLKKSFQKIDFDEPRRIAELLRNHYQRQGGATILFLQKTKKQSGEYCLEEFIDVITSNQLVALQRMEINFKSTAYQPNKYGFINAISEYLNIQISDNLQENETTLLGQIYAKINSSLSLGDTIFFEIKSINRLEDKENFIQWFMEDFWNPLISQYRKSLNENRNKLIFALISESKFNVQDCYLSQEVILNHDKMIEIPLFDWDCEDIENWLILHYKLFPRFANIQDSHKIKIEAQDIYDVSEGTPEIICSILKEYFYEQK